MQSQLESEKKANEFKKLLNLTKPGTSFDSNLQRSVEFADDKAYEDMLSQIDKDMKANHSIMRNNQKKEDYLLERTYKGIVGGVEALSIPPKGEVETYLYLHDEEVLDQKNLKKLLKFQARVTNNDEFKYYNNFAHGN